MDNSCRLPCLRSTRIYRYEIHSNLCVEVSTSGTFAPKRIAMKLSNRWMIYSLRAATSEVLATSSGTPASLALCSYSMAKPLADMAFYRALSNPTVRLNAESYRWSLRCSSKGFHSKLPLEPFTSAIPSTPAYSSVVHNSLSMVSRTMALRDAGPSCSGVKSEWPASQSCKADTQALKAV